MKRSFVKALVVAVCTVGLLAVFAPPSAAISLTSHDEEAKAALAVLPYVPTSFRSTCVIIDPRVSIPHDAFREYDQYVDGALYCRPKDGLGAYYLHFPGPNALNGAYESFLAGHDLGTFDTGSECGTDGTFSIRGTTVGRYVCYALDTAQVQPTGGARTAVEVNWTDDRSNILVAAVRTDGDDRALMNWYDSNSGPLSEPSNAGVPDALTGTAQQRAADALTRHVPQALRKACQTLDVNDPGDLGPNAYAARIWTRAAIRCTPSSGADAVTYYAFATTDSANAYLGAYDTTSSYEAPQCPAEGTYKVGKRSVGSYVCKFFGEPPAAGVVWTHDRLAIVGDATRGDGNSEALLQWWRSSGGPSSK